MAIISFSIQESEQQNVSGIPTKILASTNIACSIFYTLDGTIPTVESDIYLNYIKLPTNQNTVVLKLYATNGEVESLILTKEYKSNLYGQRNFLSEVTNYSMQMTTPAAFTDNALKIPPEYGGAGIPAIDSDQIANSTFSGYDGTATNTKIGGTDLPLPNYDFIYSTTDALGQRGHGIGTLPGTVTIRPQEAPPLASNANDKFFNPKALVIYQDSRDTPFDENIVQLNKQFFSLQDPEKTRDGVDFYTPAFDGQSLSASFLRAHHNQKDQTMTYYYFDSRALRWIISKEHYTPKSQTSINLSNMIFSPRGVGIARVFKWMPFHYRKLT